jgi:hypothetical protein
MDHRDLTGPAAIHPAFFVSDTDPSLDAANHVGAGKGWLDTSEAPTLKVRNDANDAWITALGPPPPPGIVISFAELAAVYIAAAFDDFEFSDLDFTELEYVP